MAQPIEADHVRERRPVESDRSLGELFSTLTSETSTLVRQEIALAKTEMSHMAAEAAKDVGFLVAGAAVLYIGFMAIVAAIIIALAHAIPWWVSALVVGLVIAAIGGMLVYQGMSNLKSADLTPHNTIDALKEDVS
jgi:hypothetical protein